MAKAASKKPVTGQSGVRSGGGTRDAVESAFRLARSNIKNTWESQVAGRISRWTGMDAERTPASKKCS